MVRGGEEMLISLKNLPSEFYATEVHKLLKIAEKGLKSINAKVRHIKEDNIVHYKIYN